MRKRTIWLFLSFVVILSFVIISSSVYAIAASNDNSRWWEKEFGEPRYGGIITYGATNVSRPFWDPYLMFAGDMLYIMETLWVYDWTRERSICELYSTPFVPSDYHTGWLAESWEMPDTSTITVHIRQGIHWQDKEPVNGREFMAEDVAHHYNRILGNGSGYTEPSPVYRGRTGNLKKVTAKDKYTVVFEFDRPSAINFYTILEQAALNTIEAPECVSPGTPLTDWHNAVGTGPWIVTDYVDGSSLTLTRNPNYWAMDPRYPDNQLPYADTLKVLGIPDLSTRLAAIRTGKVDFLESLEWQQTSNLKKTNPELKTASIPSIGYGLAWRVDKKPFTDIRVRKALQMAINRKVLAQTHFDGTTDGTPAGWIHPNFKGYCYDYNDWPSELKAEYDYNPDKAKKLLEEAGYPNGFKTEAVLMTGMDLEVYEIFKSYFADIGVEMDLVMMEPGTWNSYCRSWKYEQMCGNSLTGVIIAPWLSTGMNYSKDGSNYSRVNDPAYDKMFKQAQAAASEAELKELIVKLDKYTLENHWGLRTFPIYNFNISQPYLKGYNGENMLRAGRWPFARLWIDKD